MFFLGTMRRWNMDMNLCQSLLVSHFGGALLAFFVVLLFIPSAESAASSLDASYDSDASPILSKRFCRFECRRLYCFLQRHCGMSFSIAGMDA